MDVTWLALVCRDDAADLVTKWLTTQKLERRLSPHSIRAYQTDIHNFLTFACQHFGGPVQTAQLAAAEIRDFRAWLANRAKDGVSTQSRARQVATLRNFYRWCDRSGYFHNAAITVLSSPKIPHRQPHPIVEEDVFTLITEVGQDSWIDLRDRALFTLIYACGLRIAEALNVKECDITSDVLQVIGKGGRMRQVPLLPAAREAMADYLAVRPFARDINGLVFRGLKGGSLNQGLAQKRLRALRGVMGLSDSVTPHALRHSYATHLLGNGMNIREIQHLLGHASLSTTQIYTEVDYKKMLDMVRKTHPRA